MVAAFRFRRADLEGFAGFGLYQLEERTLNILASRTDQILIGALVGSQALGYYTLAWNLIILPVNRINPILTQVAFPPFAKVQNETERLTSGYMTLLRLLTTVNAPILLGCAATASTLIPVVYGGQWGAECFSYPVSGRRRLDPQHSQPNGRIAPSQRTSGSRIFWDLCAVSPQIVVVAIALLVAGPAGVVIGLLCLHIVYYFAYYECLLRRLIGRCFRPFLSNTLRPAGIAGAMAILVWLFSRYLDSQTVWALATEICAGVLVYPNY